MGNPFFIERRLVEKGGAGLCCDENGLALGPVPIIAVSGEADRRRYHMRPIAEIAETLELAFGPLAEETIRRRLAAFERIVKLLKEGDLARAAIAAVQIGLPGIDADGMAKLAAVSLRKYNPDYESESRVPAGDPASGQWTGDDGGGDKEGTETASQRKIAMSPECLEEWAAARRFCTRLQDQGLLGASGYRGFGWTYEQCLRGQVSAACGGNPVG